MVAAEFGVVRLWAIHCVWGTSIFHANPDYSRSFSLISHLCGAGVCAPRIWIMVYLSRHPANSTYTILFPGPQHQLRSFWNKFVLRVWSGEIDSSTFAFVLKVTETEILMTTEFYL